MNKEPSPEEHWASVAEELGEPVRGYALGRLVSAEEINRKGFLTSRPRWALIFVTDAAVYLEQGSSPNWFQKIVNTRREQDEPERSRIPFESITKVTVPPPKTGIYKLLASPEVLVQIKHSGTPGDLLIYLDRRGETDRKVIDLLREITPE